MIVHGFVFRAYCVLFYVALCFSGVLSDELDPAATPFNRWPMVMAHDSGTTYLEDGLLHPINDWAKTQPSGGFKGMLDCGARSFDVRPQLKDGSLTFHHGSVSVDHSFSDAIDEIIQWTSDRNHSAEDLVHLDIWDCSGGDSCMENVLQVLSSKNMSVVSDCAATATTKVSDIVDTFRIDSGGSIVVTLGCVSAHYNESIVCSGFGDNTESPRAIEDRAYLRGSATTSWSYTCYADSSTKDLPLSRMWDYVNNVVPDSNSLYSIQALWQETASTIAIGEAHLSSLLKDESKSQLNALTASRISSGLIGASNLNLIEINNVCDNGQAILDAARRVRAGLVV